MARAQNITRTNRETGTRILYYEDEKGGVVMACLGLPGEVGVADHGAVRRVRTITEGQLQTRKPSQWCAGCARLLGEGRGGSSSAAAARPDRG